MKRHALLPGFIALAVALNAAPLLAGDFNHSPLPGGETSDKAGVTVGPTTITQSTSLAIMAGNSVACTDNPPTQTLNNRYLRRFDLNGVYGIVTPFSVTGVDFGVEYANSPSPTGAQPLSINLYVVPNAAPMNYGNFTLIGNLNTNILFNSLVILSVPVTGTVADPNANDLVVEVSSPASGSAFFVGSNNLGQTAPTYLASIDCGVPQPTPTASLGVPSMHMVMVVHGESPVPALATSWGHLKDIYR